MKWFKNLFATDRRVQNLTEFKPKFFRAIREALSARGYSGTGPNYWMRTEDAQFVINIQSDKYNDQLRYKYYINLSFTPNGILEQVPNNFKINSPSTHAFQCRLYEEEVFFPLSNEFAIEKKRKR